MRRFGIVGVLLVLSLVGCKKEKGQDLLGLFPETSFLKCDESFRFERDSIGRLEMMVCDGNNNLVVFDYFENTLYDLYDSRSGKFIARFGRIGQGPAELQLGCMGTFDGDRFISYSNQTGVLVKHDLQALREGHTNISAQLTRYKTSPEIYVSRLALLSDSVFLAAGVCHSRYQYALFNTNGILKDYGVEVYNANDTAFASYARHLSNQGSLTMHPQKRWFAYALNQSSNIDFFRVEDGKLVLKKSLRLGNPLLTPEISSFGSLYTYSVNPTEDTYWGYIDLAATSEYVYALYTDKNMKEQWRMSDMVLVFDWEGTPVKKYTLDRKACCITIDGKNGRLFAAFRSPDGEMDVAVYDL